MTEEEILWVQRLASGRSIGRTPDDRFYQVATGTEDDQFRSYLDCSVRQKWEYKGLDHLYVHRDFCSKKGERCILGRG